MSNDWIKIEVCRQANERVAAMMKIEAMKAENDQAKFHHMLPEYDGEDFLKVMEAYGFDKKGLEKKNQTLEG